MEAVVGAPFRVSSDIVLFVSLNEEQDITVFGMGIGIWAWMNISAFGQID